MTPQYKNFSILLFYHKMIFLFLLLSGASAIFQTGYFSIGQDLIRRKRDLIGWNRTQNTVNQYVRHKTDDKKRLGNQYIQKMMQMNKEQRHGLDKQFRKAIKMIQKMRKSKKLLN